MIKIANIHPDVIAAERLRLNAPRFNAEWLELFNAGGRPVDVNGYLVVTAGGDSFVITLPRRKTLLLGPYHALVIFSGFPDNPADPGACYLAHQGLRLFLKRDKYLWDPEEDGAQLYTSRAAYVNNPEDYIDHYQYKRRSASVIISSGR
jgi:hypothetical protein